MSNETTFAIAYRRASIQLMEAVAAQSPSAEMESALHSAQRAWCAAGNIIEETLAGKLIDAIELAQPLITA